MITSITIDIKIIIFFFTRMIKFVCFKYMYNEVVFWIFIDTLLNIIHDLIDGFFFQLNITEIV